MINYDTLERRVTELHNAFVSARPFSHLVLDGFCNTSALRELLAEIPDPSQGGVGLSRDYVFAKEKYEKSAFKGVGPRSLELYNELTSERFQALLTALTGEQVFVDTEFHGGGFHQGGPGSFLDMHVDFNYHPVRPTWFRNLNILIYLNDEWNPTHRGSLKLKHLNTCEQTEIEPLFNRCVIMHTRDYTLHGYDPIDFPNGKYRRSIASYAYTLKDQPGSARSTTWYPETGGALKQMLGRAWPTLVALKTRFLGSATTRNK